MSINYGIIAEKEIAKQFENKGYVVILHPDKTHIPFDLGKYLPDLLAYRGNEHILIEVKTSKSKVDTKKFIEVSELIESHTDWKFMIVTVDDKLLNNEGDEKKYKNNYLDLKKELDLIGENLKNKSIVIFLIPHLWVVYISFIRNKIDALGLSHNGLTDLSILNMAYSEGLVSHLEYEKSKCFLELRNHSVHNIGHSIDLDYDFIISFYDCIKNELDKALDSYN
ncbi:hypothetical protein [Pantoea sp. GbtcB22]|uniref:hypothetical protein n=1 Tax=Pantoea sp. GbtcB22 TaxID=2824767 RepID=UPI001C2FABAF|nr:hypothetical protein [Pantoea sp. GbtcB22]